MQFLCEHSVPFLATWPSSGMTRNGVAYEQPTPELPTVDSGSSYLPTPMASDGEKGGPNQRGGSGDLRLSSAVHLMPTPNTSSGTGPGEHGAGGPNLQAVMSLFPTPAAMIPNDGEQPETWLARRERVKLTAKNGNGMGMPLSIASILLQRGESTSPPSAAGSTSLAE